MGKIGDKLYSADRRGFYQIGALPLHASNPLPHPSPMLRSHRNDFEGDDIGRHVLDLFPDGLSLHGWQYISMVHHPHKCDEIWWVANEPTIELVFEFVRRAQFPDRPSRLQSYFAFDTLERARSFSGASIYELSVDMPFRADQTWLNVSNQMAVASYNAHQYWSGAPSADPDWEYLLKAPVSVVGRIQ